MVSSSETLQSIHVFEPYILEGDSTQRAVDSPRFPWLPPMALSWSTLGVRATLTYITAKAENRRKTKSTAEVGVEALQLSGWCD